MKILLSMNIPYLFAHGGANKANRLLAEELAARGHEVEVVVPALGVPSRITLTELAGRLERQGVAVRLRPGALEIQLNGVALHAATDAAGLRGLLRDRIAAFAPDWVLTSTEDPSQNLLAAALGAAPGRVVYLAHSPTFLPFGPQAFFASPTRARLLEKVSAIVTCSRFVERYVRRWGGYEARTIHWPAYGRGPFPDLSRFDGGRVTMINPCAVKGLAIFRRLVETLPEVPFAAVPTWGTTSDDRMGLADLPNLRFLQAADDIEAILAESRVLLMPSLWPEGFPLTCVEAMARGIPVLASDVEGLAEAKLGTGFVLPVRPIGRFAEEVDENLVPRPVIPEQDATPWREALLRILADRDLYQEESRAERRAALDFIGAVSAQPFEALLEELGTAPRIPVAAAPAPAPRRREAAAPGVAALDPRQQALLSLWLRQKAAAAEVPGGPPPLVPVPRDRPLPLSFAQQRLWFLDQLEPGSPLYNMPSAVRLAGGVDPAVLRETLAALAARHEILRTTFPSRDGAPVQAIAARLDVSLPSVDLAALPDGARAEETARLSAREALRPFDLERGPLLRATLLRLGRRAHVLLLTLHHTISDGWSFGILVREVAALYEAFSAGLPSPLPPLAVQYADFAVWQRGWLQGARLAAEVRHWKERLAGLPPPLDLPADRPRPSVPSVRSDSRSLRFAPAQGAEAMELARRSGASLFMVLLTAWKVLLARHTGEEDLAVGAPIANRNRPEVEGLLGLFVNTLVLRTDLAGDPPWNEALARVRDACLDAYAHQDLPFEKLVEALQPERNLSHSPLFAVQFVHQNLPDATFELPGLLLEPMGQGSDSAKLDLNLTVVEGAGGCTLTLSYRRDRFDGTTAARLLARLAALLAAASRDPRAPLSRLDLLPESERHQLLAEWNDTADARRGGDDLIERFAAVALRHPDRIAAVDGEGGGREMTFRELHRRAAALAASLVRRGVGPEVRVGLLMGPCLEMVVAVLGILGAGGAYVPFDVDAPERRLADLLADAGLALVLTRRDRAVALPVGAMREVVCLDDEGPAAGALAASEREPRFPRSGLPPERLAYLIYTSGSTGRPKAVGNGHRQLLSYLDAVAVAMDLDDGPAGYELHQTPAVDASLTHLFLPLLRGGTLHLFAAEEIGDPDRFAARLADRPVDYFKFAPSHFEAVLRAAAQPERLFPRRGLMLGGEATRWDLVARIRRLASCGLLIHYGPTETTVGSLTYRVAETGDPFASATVPIGRALANNRTCVVDRCGLPVPIGAIGELLLGGPGVARGYVDRPDRTGERFLPDPFAGTPGARLYRTGDLVRHLPDGRLEFLGRSDQQVKVRGFRVELGEIEAAIAALPGVSTAVVSQLAGDGRLAAYYVVAPGAQPAAAELRAALAELLPSYMVPAVFVALAALPRTAHGKVDRRALPAPAGSATAADRVAPRNAVEATMAAIWAEVLGVPAVGVHDGFFELGGHSLLAMQLVSRLRRAVAPDLPLRVLFERPTIAGLAEWLAAQTTPAARRPALTATSRAEHRRERRGSPAAGEG